MRPPSLGTMSEMSSLLRRRPLSRRAIDELDPALVGRDVRAIATPVPHVRALGRLLRAAARVLALGAIDVGSIAVALYTGLATLAMMLAFIRNWFGLLVVALSGVAVGVLIWRAPEHTQDLAALTFAWFLLIAAPRTVIDLWSHRRRVRTRTTDADVLARLTHLPTPVWNLFFLLVTAAALAAAIWLVD